MALTRVNFTDVLSITRASVKNTFQPVDDGFGNISYELVETAAGQPAYAWNPATGEPLGISIEESRTNFNLWSNDLSKLNLASTGDFTPPVASFDQEIFGRPASKVTFSTGTTGYSRVNLTSKARVNGEFYTIKFCAKSLSGTQELVVSIAGIGNTVVTVTEQEQVFEVPVEWNIAGGTFPASVGQTPAELRTTGEFVIGFLQDEDGSFGTSLIETNGFTATRAADVVTTDSLVPWFNATQGTIVVDFQLPTYRQGFGRIFEFGSGATGAGLAVQTASAGNERIAVYYRDGVNPTVTLNDSGALTDNQRVKVAISYKNGEIIKISFNGAATLTSSTAYDPILNPDTLYVGSSSLSFFQMSGAIKDIKYYPKAVSDAELQALSTL